MNYADLFVYGLCTLMLLAFLFALVTDRKPKGVIPKYDGPPPPTPGRFVVMVRMEYQGLWNARTNTPQIPRATEDNKGHYYLVSLAALDHHGYPHVAPTGFDIGDWLVSDGTTWRVADSVIEAPAPPPPPPDRIIREGEDPRPPFPRGGDTTPGAYADMNR